MSRKEAFERKVEAQLKELSIEIQRLLDQVDAAGVEVGGEMIRAIEEICGRWTDAERERNRVRTAGEEGWEHLQSRLEAALEDLKSAVEPAVARVRRAPANVSPMANTHWRPALGDSTRDPIREGSIPARGACDMTMVARRPVPGPPRRSDTGSTEPPHGSS